MQNSRPYAVITGATSGIGRLFAERFAEKGYNLVISGRRAATLNEAAEKLFLDHGIRVRVFVGDLSEDAFRNDFAVMLGKIPNIEVLVNNAGFGIDKPFCNIEPADIHAMVNTHIQSTVDFTHAVLPAMIRNRKGTIINVSSLGAFIPGFTRSLYLSTKSFIHSFSVALSMEMAPYGIKVQSLCPGMTRTDFHRDGIDGQLEKKLKGVPFMDPETVVDVSLRKLEKGRVLCIPGTVNHVFYGLARVLPRSVLRMMSGFRIEKSKAGVSSVVVI